jgi:hypothetical protein
MKTQKEQFVEWEETSPRWKDNGFFGNRYEFEICYWKYRVPARQVVAYDFYGKPISFSCQPDVELVEEGTRELK